MSARPEILEEDIHAFIDGELDAARAAAVEDAAGRDPVLAHRIASFRADKRLLAEVYGTIAGEALPQEWRARVAGRARPRRGSWTTPFAAAAAALVLLLASVTVYRFAVPKPVETATSGEESIVREALAARSDALKPREVVKVDGMDAAGRVVADALKLRLKAPDLARMGYRLVSVRVYGDMPGGSSVELVYRGAANRDFALYVRHPSGAVRFDQYKRDGLRVCIWQDDVLGTVMTGRMSAAEMQRLASLAYTGLES